MDSIAQYQKHVNFVPQPPNSKQVLAKHLLRVMMWIEGKFNSGAVDNMGVSPNNNNSNSMILFLRKIPNQTKLSLAVLFVAIIFAFCFLLLANLPASRAQNLLFISPAKGSWELAKELEKAEIISSSMLFRAAIGLSFGKPLKAGEYKIKKNDSYADIIETMRKGRSARFKFTVPEGRTNYEIREMLKINTMLKGGVGKLPDEGTLLPETYFVFRGKWRIQIIKQMHKEHNKIMTELWNRRSKDLPIKTIKDAVILASIVEKETGLDEERELVAGVFINRLNKKSYMQLQSDPTVIYALTEGKPFGRELTYSDLRKDGPYNTYRNYGLPPGAIANPGRKALSATLNPVKTPYFYFVANGTGGHAFAETYEGHLENVKKWRSLNGEQSNSDVEDEPDAKIVQTDVKIKSATK